MRHCYTRLSNMGIRKILVRIAACANYSCRIHSMYTHCNIFLNPVHKFKLSIIHQIPLIHLFCSRVIYNSLSQSLTNMIWSQFIENRKGSEWVGWGGKPNITKEHLIRIHIHIYASSSHCVPYSQIANKICRNLWKENVILQKYFK